MRTDPTAALDTLPARYHSGEITRGELFVALLSRADDPAFARVASTLPDAERGELIAWTRHFADGSRLASGQGPIAISDAARVAAATWLRSVNARARETCDHPRNEYQTVGCALCLQSEVARLRAVLTDIASLRAHSTDGCRCRACQAAAYARAALASP